MAIQSPFCTTSEEPVSEGRHSSRTSSGISCGLISFNIRLKFGPGALSASPKSSPNEVPSARAAATYATPIDAPLWIGTVAGILAAL